MPRGYLKHNRDAGKKKARGGSSGQKRNCGKAHAVYLEKEPELRQRCANYEDFVIDVPTTEDSIPCRNEGSYPIGECAICFNKGPLVYISKKCKWHGAACNQCLHSIYVTNAQKCSPKGYPLTCYHPLCDQPIHAAQLEKHNIFNSSDEKTKHHEMLVLSQIQKNKGRTVRCPRCDMPRGIQKLGDSDHTLGCANCNSRYLVSPFYATLRALDNMKSDSIGINDGWAKCPNCAVLISKGDGCDHMWCTACDYNFSWDVAQQQKDLVPHAKVPSCEIHLWW